jgi:hypothetical protein
MSENRDMTDEALYASKSLVSLVNLYIPYMLYSSQESGGKALLAWCEMASHVKNYEALQSAQICSA